MNTFPCKSDSVLVDLEPVAVEDDLPTGALGDAEDACERAVFEAAVEDGDAVLLDVRVPPEPRRSAQTHDGIEGSDSFFSIHPTSVSPERFLSTHAWEADRC